MLVPHFVKPFNKLIKTMYFFHFYKGDLVTDIYKLFQAKLTKCFNDADITLYPSINLTGALKH